MGVDQPECGAGRASPASITNTDEKKSEKRKRIFSVRCVGIVFLGVGLMALISEF